MNDKWYDYFLEILAEKFPKKSKLAQELMELLCIEREAVDRRLRREVVFTAHEIIKIAYAWNISVDEMMNTNSGNISFQMQQIHALNPSEEGLKILQKRVNDLDYFKTAPNSEYMVVFNNISRSLSSGFASIYRFNVFKWMYQYRNESNYLPFSQVIIAEKLQNIVFQYYQSLKHVKNTSYIFENNMFEYLVRDILFFHSILLITDEEKELIKKELYALLDYLLEVANTGCFPETGNKVQIYVSMININTNYSCYYSEQLKQLRIHAFNLYDVQTYHPEMIELFRTWMQLMKRTSIQISEVDERSRIEFFTKQRKLLEQL
jgi:hypothetical protein